MRGFWGFLLLTWLGLCATGCQSFNSPAPNSLASVTISNRSIEEITQATQTVFQEKGFTAVDGAPGQFTFERPGDRMNNLAYATYMNNAMVTVRVVVELKPINPTSTVLLCNAWLVENAGNPVFEDDHKVPKIRRRPYEELLKDIRDQLKE